MNNNFIIKSFNPNYRRLILELFSLAYSGRNLQANCYQWRYEENPFGPVMIDLMFDGDILVGHYAACPNIGNFLGIDYPIVLSMHTFTHPNYWGKGIFTELAENLYRKISENYGIFLVYGFPNTNSHYNFVKKLSWRDVFLVPTLKRDVNIDIKGKKLGFRIVESADERFDKLWIKTKKKKKYFFANARTSKFINWRFKMCPTNKYTILAIESSSNLEGYAVVKEHLNEGQLELDLVDFLIYDNVDGIAFLNGVIDYAFSFNYKSINAWIPLAYQLYNCAEKIGFKPQMPFTYLAFRLFKDISGSEFLYQPGRWYLTMADSDIY